MSKEIKKENPSEATISKEELASRFMERYSNKNLTNGCRVGCLFNIACFGDMYSRYTKFGVYKEFSLNGDIDGMNIPILVSIKREEIPNYFFEYWSYVREKSQRIDDGVEILEEKQQMNFLVEIHKENNGENYVPCGIDDMKYISKGDYTNEIEDHIDMQNSIYRKGLSSILSKSSSDYYLESSHIGDYYTNTNISDLASRLTINIGRECGLHKGQEIIIIGHPLGRGRLLQSLWKNKIDIETIQMISMYLEVDFMKAGILDKSIYERVEDDKARFRLTELKNLIER